MFLKNYNLMFFTTLAMGTMVALSASNWFTAWLGMEINLMSMTPLILVKLNKPLSEAAIKYFITQALASLGMIITAVVVLLNSSHLSLGLMNMVLTISILIKMGMVPFHFWFPSVIENLGWMQCAILFTWQKIAPFSLIFFLENSMITTSAFFSALMGALGGLNQNNSKIILTFSSISHSGWMTNTIILNFNMWVIYFLIYSTISLSLIFSLAQKKNHKIKNSLTSSLNPWETYNISFNLLSLGGIPPLLGFMAKMSAIMVILQSTLYFVFFPLILSSLISLYFYLRLIYTSLFAKQNKNFFFKHGKKLSLMMFVMSIFFSVMTPTLMIQF